MNASAVDMLSDAFGSLIGPVSTATFFERYFESDLLHVARGDPLYFAGLYDVGCVEDALAVGANDPDRFALIKHDTPPVTREHMTSKRSIVRARASRGASRSMLDPRSVLAAFAAGYTLNIKDAGADHPRLAQLCNRIQSQLSWHIRANVYFTPPRAQGFEIHYDTHDTLVVQVEGEKNWQVYAPVVALPLETQPFSESAHHGKLAAPRAIRLAAGDSLYIPHGFPHTAATTEHRSLHLTFAISPLRGVDLLDSLVELAARGDVELRRALPQGWERDPNFATSFAARMAELIPRAIASARIPAAADQAFNGLFAATSTTATGMFDTLAAFEAMRPMSRISLRNDTPYQLRERGELLDVVLAAKIVTIPASSRAGFSLLDAGPATFAAIEAILPDGTGSTFVRTLVMEGLVLVHA